MALVKTITEVKEVHPRLLSSNSKDAWLPNMDAAEYKYLVPLLGLALYSDINTKYNTDSTGLTGLTTIEKALRLKMIAVTVAAAYMDEISRNTAKITDNGVRTANSNEMQRIFGWEYKEFKQGITDLYYDGVEVLLQWLYDNKASFALYTSSDAYARYNGLLIKQGADFNDQYRLYQPMRTYWLLREVVQDVQDNYHTIALGATLLSYFVTLTAPTAAEKVILKTLKKAMAFLTVYRACRMHAVRFSDTGFVLLNNDVDQKSTAASDSFNMIEMKMRAAEQDGLQQMTRAKRLCSELRAAGSGYGAGFATGYDAGPLVGYTEADIETRNGTLTSGFRFGI